WKVAELVRHGLTNRRIAERMGVSPDAVKFHVGNALSKLGFASRTELRGWYRDTLGLPELYAFPGLAFFDLGGVRLMLTEEEGDGPVAESILYLRVPDLHSVRDELAGRGVNFTHAPHMIHRHEDGTEEW